MARNHEVKVKERRHLAGINLNLVAGGTPALRYFIPHRERVRALHPVTARRAAVASCEEAVEPAEAAESAFHGDLMYRL